MRKLLLFVLSAFCLSSCVDKNPKPTIDEQDPDWIRLEIPNGREAYAIAGDIDKTLLVTTWTKAYYTTDQGRTWHESKNFNGPVPGLFVRNDTIFSLEASGNDTQGNKYASLGQYFTTDVGKSWSDYSEQHDRAALYVKQPIGYVQANTGAVYKIKENATPVSPGATTAFYINPSDIVKENAMGQQLIRFPFKHKLINLFLDQNNRLYVAASGGVHDEKDNTIICCSNDLPAIVYISKKPLP